MMIREPISKQTRIILGIASCVVLIGMYSWLSYRQHVFNPKDTSIPNFGQFVDGFKKVVTPDDSGERWLVSDMRATYSRHLGGMIVGVLLSFIVGLSMGVWAPAEAFFQWPVSFFAKIPPTAMMPIYFVLFGTDYNMFIAMIALGIFPTLAQAIYQAAKNDVPDSLIYKAYTLGSSHFEVIWHVVYKQILPRFIESVRLCVGPALVFLIAAEMLVADSGFGYRLRLETRMLHMNVTYLYLIILGITFFAMDLFLTTLRKKLCPWFDGKQT